MKSISQLQKEFDKLADFGYIDTDSDSDRVEEAPRIVKIDVNSIENLSERIEKLESAYGGKKKRKIPITYNNFVSKHAKLIKNEHPKMKFGDVAREISKRWKMEKRV